MNDEVAPFLHFDGKRALQNAIVFRLVAYDSNHVFEITYLLLKMQGNKTHTCNICARLSACDRSLSVDSGHMIEGGQIRLFLALSTPVSGANG